MKRWTLALFFCLAISARAHAGYELKTIDFESITAGNISQTAFSSWGVTFDTTWEVVPGGNGNAPACSPTHWAHTLVSDYNSYGEIAFDAPVSYVSAQFNHFYNGAYLDFAAYDSAGDLLTNSSILETNKYQPLTLESDGIATVRVYARGQDFAMDDFSFGTTAVPVPSSLLLASIGIITLGVGRRFRRKI